MHALLARVIVINLWSVWWR